LLHVRVVPGAKKSQLAGEESGRLKVRIQAPPVEGKANRELLRLLARELGLKKNRIALISGEHSRDKELLLKNMSLAEARVMLKSALDEK
jgi:uncharacterized protein (TIGR00251 family)